MKSGTRRTQVRLLATPLRRAVAQVLLTLHAAWKEKLLPCRLPRLRSRKADGTALLPSREVAEKVRSGSERAKSRRANKKLAYQFADGAAKQARANSNPV